MTDGKSDMEKWIPHLKNAANFKKRQIFKKIWDIEANLVKLTALTISKEYIKIILLFISLHLLFISCKDVF